MHRAVLLQPETGGNVGFIARLAENFSIDEIVLVDPQCELDGEAERYAAHAAHRLDTAEQVGSVDDAVDDLDVLLGTTGIKVDEGNVHRHGIPPRAATANMPGDADVGVLLGREGTGLSNEELDRCDTVVTIPTAENYPVMNLSHAAAVLFYELFQARECDGSTSRTGDGTPSTRKRRAVLENLFKGLTDRLDWDGTRRERTVRAFRNVLGRAYVTDRELQLLLGAFRETRDRIGDT
ncbi:MAG: TrmJ/YjtD family RNA methyltransferase [Candidatus Nanohaloarchaea archaeon]|nr:TrmJ/YjtD family RNA methyltransferase [Candidatus Nanohaloarchaea archaeon]